VGGGGQHSKKDGECMTPTPPPPATMVAPPLGGGRNSTTCSSYRHTHALLLSLRKNTSHEKILYAKLYIVIQPAASPKSPYKLLPTPMGYDSDPN